jgi:hypothetical protein
LARIDTQTLPAIPAGPRRGCIKISRAAAASAKPLDDQPQAHFIRDLLQTT